MGSLRGLNLLLGMSPFLQTVWDEGSLLAIPLYLGGHIACVTFLSTYEEGRPDSPGFKAVLVLDVGLVLWATFRGPQVLPALATGLPLAAAMSFRGVQVLLEPRRNLTFEVVKAGVVGILLLDATFLLGHGHAGWAAAVLALFLPRILLAGTFRGT
jgi:hypothetical protein